MTQALPEASMPTPLPSLPPELSGAFAAKGFTELTSVQRAVIAADTHARDLRISSQTGSGKTVAVGIALARDFLRSGPRQPQGSGLGPTALLLTPTRELALQVHGELTWLLAKVPDSTLAVTTGGTSLGLDKRRLRQNPRLVVATPGRLLDHLKTGALDGSSVRQVILDEADQMLDMGFRDELSAILERLPERERTHLVSATFSGGVLAIAKRYQASPVHLEGSPLGSANRDIRHVAHVVPNAHRYDALVNLLLAHQARTEGTPRALVFVRTRLDAQELSLKLQDDGLAAEPLSGDLSQAERARTLNAFRNGQLTTLIATDIAARGLDVEGIELVVHGDPPTDADTYIHRSGRTGRAGKPGTSVLLLPPQARARIGRLLAQARIEACFAPPPNGDKVQKLFAKLGRRRVFAAMAQPASPKNLSHASKLLEEHDPSQLVATLLEMVEVQPPCRPRQIPTAPARERSLGRHQVNGMGNPRREEPQRAFSGPQRGPRANAPRKFRRGPAR